MGRLESKHWALIASFLISTAAVVGGLDHWSDMTKPAIVAGLLAQLGTLLGAVFAGAPKNPDITADNHPARRDTDLQPPPDLGTVSASHSSQERF